ncbi:MAG: hypothetical protein N4R13_00295 [Lactobacillus crispatus]|nr:hypothetical protein [Lactobacillus crispatus]MCT7815268.1 hypothetical protein [Lactobacillus crispatus]
MTDKKEDNKDGSVGCAIGFIIIIAVLVGGFLWIRHSNEQSTANIERQERIESQKAKKSNAIKKQKANQTNALIVKNIKAFRSKNDPDTNWSKYVSKVTVNSKANLSVEVNDRFVNLSDKDKTTGMRGINKEATWDAYHYGLISKSKVGNRLWAQIFDDDNNEMGRSTFDVYDNYKWN